MVIERYEMKYRIPPPLAAPIRAVVQAYCDPDSANEGGRYMISSLYLDSAQRRLYRETMTRQPRRYKLRVRRYAGPEHYLEIKRRIKEVVHKSRIRIPGDAWPGALLDPRLSAGLDLGPEGRRDLDDFVARCLRIGAEPATVVRYERDAWVGRDEDYARVTFDQYLTAAEPAGWIVPVADADADWHPVDTPDRYGLTRSGLVLELKCTAAVPLWMTDLVHRFGLKRTGFSKYATCLEHVERWRRPVYLPRRSALR